MKKIFNSSLLILIFAIGMVAFNGHAHAMDVSPINAQDKVLVDNQVGFSAVPETNENQLPDKDNSFFWLGIKPKQTVTVYISVVNGKRPGTFEISANQAITNRNLSYDYQASAKTVQNSIAKQTPFTINKIANVDGSGKNIKKISLPANTRARIPITITMPTTQYHGLMLGGINVVRDLTKAEKAKAGISSRYAFTVALALQEGDLDSVNPDVKAVKIQGVSADHYQVKTIFTVQNATFKNIKDATFKGEISNQKNHVISKLKLKGRVSPMAKVGLYFNHGKKLAAGKYHLRATMTDNTTKQVWKFNKTFVVSAKGAKQAAKQAVYHAPFNWLILAIVLIFVILIGLIIWLLFLLKRKKKE